MSGKRDVLEALKRDELLDAADRLDLPVRDRRVRDKLIDALASSRKAGLAGILEGFSRDRLKEICRALDLDDSGREKAMLIDRLAGQDSTTRDSRNGGPSPRGARELALEEGQERAVTRFQEHDLAAKSPRSSAARSKPQQPSRRGTSSNSKDKSLESWIWDAACSIRGAQEAPKFKDFILPLIFTKRLCDVFDDELDRIAVEVGSRAKAFKLVEMDHKLVRFYLPLKPQDPDEPVWSLIRKLTDKIGQTLTDYLHGIAKANPALKGIIDRMEFNATTHGQRDIDDDRLSNLIERISVKRLGLKDVEADVIGRSYEFLIRKFAEGSGQSAGEFFTPPEVARVMALIMDPEPDMSVYDPCCGSAGLLIACEHVLDDKMKLRSRPKRRKEFFKEFKELEMLYEIVSRRIWGFLSPAVFCASSALLEEDTANLNLFSLKSLSRKCSIRSSTSLSLKPCLISLADREVTQTRKDKDAICARSSRRLRPYRGLGDGVELGTRGRRACGALDPGLHAFAPVGVRSAG